MAKRENNFKQNKRQWQEPKTSSLWESEVDKAIQRKFLFGIMMARPLDIEKSLVIARPTDFCEQYIPVYELLADRIQTGRDVSLESLLEEDSRGVLLDAFGSLADITLAASQSYLSAELPTKALLVREWSIKRELHVRLMQKIVQIEAGSDIFELMFDLEQDVSDLYPVDMRGGLIDVGEVIMSEVGRASLSAQEKEQGYIKTGFSSVDRMIYGFLPGEFVVIGGRPAMGKTGFAISLSRNLVKAGVQHGFFSIEMTKEQITRRYISQITGIPVGNLAYGQLDDEQFARMSSAMSAFGKITDTLSLDDSSSATTQYIRSRTKQLIAERGVKIILVDYLQKVPVVGRFDNRTAEVKHISGELAKLAKDCNIVVVAFAQLSRASEARSDKRPQLSDLRESGDIEQDAHRVAFIHRPSKYGHEKLDNGEPSYGKAEIIWEKTRDGETGTCVVDFDDALIRFHDNNHYMKPWT